MNRASHVSHAMYRTGRDVCVTLTCSDRHDGHTGRDNSVSAVGLIATGAACTGRMCLASRLSGCAPKDF